jgi:hypothetical protein
MLNRLRAEFYGYYNLLSLRLHARSYVQYFRTDLFLCQLTGYASSENKADLRRKN